MQVKHNFDGDATISVPSDRIGEPSRVIIVGPDPIEVAPEDMVFVQRAIAEQPDAFTVMYDDAPEHAANTDPVVPDASVPPAAVVRTRRPVTTESSDVSNPAVE